MAKKPGIKTFSNCFNEMKRLSGDSLSDKEINEFLDEIKIKINEDKFREGEAKTEKINGDIILKLEHLVVEDLPNVSVVILTGNRRKFIDIFYY